METNTNNSYSDEIEIDLGEVLMLMWHYLWLIILSAVIAGVIGFCISRFAITPLYQSTTQVYILNEKESNSALTYSDLQLGSQLTKDYAAMIKSRSVLEKVIANLQLDETYEALASRVSVSNTADTRILKIEVTDPAPLWAQSIADEIRNVASKHIIDVMGIEAVNVVDYADLPTVPASPSIKKWTAIGFVVGAFLCIAFILIRFLLDDTVKTSEDVEKFLSMSTLAMIPLMDEQEAQKEKARQEKIIKSNEADMGTDRPVVIDREDDLKVEELTPEPEEPVKKEPAEAQKPESQSTSGSHSGQSGHSSQSKIRKGRR